MKIDLDNIVSLLRDAIEEEDWKIVEQVLEVLRTELDNPFNEYEKDVDIDEYIDIDIIEKLYQEKKLEKEREEQDKIRLREEKLLELKLNRDEKEKKLKEEKEEKER